MNLSQRNSVRLLGMPLEGMSPTPSLEALSKRKKKAFFLKKDFEKAKRKSLPSRISFWSRQVQKNPSQFLKQWKSASAPQAPEIKDQAPLIPDQFNCTTYVETIAALARSNSANDFFPELKKIRYRNGRATFGSRNHFPSGDWIPNNVTAGLLNDITQSVAKKAELEVAFQEKTIMRKRWIDRQLNKGRISRGLATFVKSYWKEEVPVKLPYIGLDQFDSVKKHIPQGTVLNVVRQSKSDYDVLISHQGFIIRSGDQVYFRHASIDGKVKTVSLDRYLKAQSNEDWKVVGFNLNQFK